MVELRRIGAPSLQDRGGRRFDLILIRVAGRDDDFGQTMRREQDSERDRGIELRTRLLISPAKKCRRRSHETSVRVIAAERCRLGSKPDLGRGFAPIGERAAGRCGRIMRIEREQQNPVWVPRPHLPRRFLGERVPIAHGDKAPHVPGRQSPFERFGLLNRQLEQRGLAAKQRIVFARGFNARARDDPRQQRPDEKRHSQNRRITKQVE